jgi:transcriptional regulator with XRE-family HTH domain
MEVGKAIRAARRRHGVSQRQLAYRTRSSQQSISRIERGLVSPTLATVERIAAALGEELHVEMRPREVPFEDAQLYESVRTPLPRRFELAVSWNRFAGEIAGTGLKALRERGR